MSNDENGLTVKEALRAAILAAPDDDLPRLQYADHLEETGDERDCAEFIRLQIEVVAAKRIDSFRWARTQAMIGRPSRTGATTLVCRDWVGLPKLAMPWEPVVPVTIDCRNVAVESGLLRAVFRRGFAERVEASAEMWLKHAADLTARHPIRSVRLATFPKTEGRSAAGVAESHFTFRGDHPGLAGVTLNPVGRLLSDVVTRLLKENWPGIAFDPLPPQLVGHTHVMVRRDGTVFDGRHRVEAARGRPLIEILGTDGDDS